MKKKANRLDAIKMIISSKDVSSQEELLQALSKEGFELTQATLSRDLKQLKVAKEHCIIIEDSTYGIEAAIRADIKVAALKDERFHYDQTKATYLVHDLLEAYHLILKGED